MRVFSNESALWNNWPKYWSFSFSISPYNEYSGLVTFRIDWLDFLAVQRTLKSLLQHHSSKVSILWHLAVLMVQLTYVCDYWKSHTFDHTDLCWQSDVSAFSYTVWVCHSLPSKEQASFSFMAEVTVRNDLGSQESKICHCFHFFSICLPWTDGNPSRVW